MTESEYKRAYYLAHREDILAKNRARRAANKEKTQAQARAYYLAHKDKVLANVQKWKDRNPEKVKAVKRAWVERNREKARENWRRNARLKRDREAMRALGLVPKPVTDKYKKSLRDFITRKAA